jgi:enoyl-CoA hydratase/carnithine racemase
VRAITAALLEDDGDPSVRVVLLRGAGKAWCAGGDVDEILALMQGPPAARRAYLSAFKAMIEAVRGIAKPVIAVVHGACVAGGNELNVACDLTLASENARFGQAGPRVGSVPVFGIPQDFHLLVGEKRSKEVTYLCRLYTAAEAEQMGWINEVVPADRLDATAEEWAREIVDKSPTSIAIAKKLHNAHHTSPTSRSTTASSSSPCSGAPKRRAKASRRSRGSASRRGRDRRRRAGHDASARVHEGCVAPATRGSRSGRGPSSDRPRGTRSGACGRGPRRRHR